MKQLFASDQSVHSTATEVDAIVAINGYRNSDINPALVSDGLGFT